MANLKKYLPAPGQLLLVAVVTFLIVFFGQDLFTEAQTFEADANYAGDTYRAEVIEILEAGLTDLGGRQQPYQVAAVRPLEGPYQGQRFEIDYGLRQLRPAELNLSPGEVILITVAARPEGGVGAYFTDFLRGSSLLWLFLLFVAVSILISRWKAVRSLLGMAFSLLVIIGFILPQILAGRDPVWVSIGGSFVLLATSIYLVYGWTLKSHAAVLGTGISLVITGLLANWFMTFARLSGFGSEEAMFLIQQAGESLNLRGLLLGGMLIGALGVLDDLVITQASVVFELHAANPALDVRSLFSRAMRVGSDHVAATVNTLVLAYAGASLPLLLLFSLSGQAPANLFNLEFVAEEIVRTLVGSLGLMASVPLTTGLTCLVAAHHDRLGAWEKWLGPVGEGHHH